MTNDELEEIRRRYIDGDEKLTDAGLLLQEVDRLRAELRAPRLTVVPDVDWLEWWDNEDGEGPVVECMDIEANITADGKVWLSEIDPYSASELEQIAAKAREVAAKEGE